METSSLMTSERQVDQISSASLPLSELLRKIGESEQTISEEDAREFSQLLLKSEKSQLDKLDNDGETALQIAARYGFKEQAEELIDKGADINTGSENQFTALMEACFNGQTTMVDLLLKRGAKADVADEQGLFPLYYAVEGNEPETLRPLLSLDSVKKNINSREKNEGWTPLNLAIYKGNEAIVSILLDKGASMDTTDDVGWTPIMTATRQQHAGVLKVLLEHSQKSGILLREKVDIRDKEGFTPLLVASKEGYADIAAQLIAVGADINAKDNTGQTALHLASERGQYDIAELLLEKDADINAKDNNGQTALHLASERGQYDVAELLLEKDADINAKDNIGQTALHLASKRGQYDVAELLLEKDADINAKDNTGQTALHLASREGIYCLVRLLLEKKAEVNAQDQANTTALHLASAIGRDVESQTAFQERESDASSSSETNNDESRSWENLLVVGTLLRHGANPASTTTDGTTVLESAVKGGEPAIIELFLKLINQMSITREIALNIFESAFKPEDTKTESTLPWRNGEMKALEHYARNPRAHTVVEGILKLRSTLGRDTKSSECSAIELAAYEGLPEVLRKLIEKSDSENKHREMELALVSTLSRFQSMKTLEKELPYQRLFLVLGLLIAASESTKKVRDAIETAKGLFDQYKRHLPEKQENALPKVPGKPQKDRTASPQQQHFVDAIRDILQDPPFDLAQMQKDEKKYKLPTPKSDVSTEIDATIVRFYKKEGASLRIRRNRSVLQLIYEKGPTEVMKSAMQQLASITGDDNIDKEKFTWIHLPSTNMDWMNDILTRIMFDEKHQSREYNEVRSFFRDSWVQVPDRESPSRIMRPQTVKREQNIPSVANTNAQEEEKEEIPTEAKENPKKEKRAVIQKEKKEDHSEKADKADGNQKGENQRPYEFVKASAIYMPYLCFSSYDKKENVESKKEKVESKKEKVESKKEKVESKKEKAESKKEKVESKKDNQKAAIHKSPTLDEWYYQFADDDPSRKDKIRRNASQVVSKYVHRQGGLENRDKFTILRVSQLWIWTIADHWIVTATPSLEDEQDSVVEGILEQLRREAEHVGSRSQPGSVADIIPIIVDYCISLYDKIPNPAGHAQHTEPRPPVIPAKPTEAVEPATSASGASPAQPTETAEPAASASGALASGASGEPEDKASGEPKDKDNGKRPIHSIGQTFSHFMNQIGSQETTLFQEFRNWTQSSEDQSNRNRQENGSSRDSSPEKGSVDAPPDSIPATGKIKDALKEAKKLYCDIKDVRDELNILKAVAQYQETVQRGLSKGVGENKRLLSTYVVRDIAGMEAVAERIQSAVNTTLSLYQSDLSLHQSELSLQQSKIANLQAKLAIGQGRTIMVFTFATILFLPLSFLSSLFALDVESFQKAPNWAFYVIFFGSVGVALFFGLGILYWEIVESYAKKLLGSPGEPKMSDSSRPVVEHAGKQGKAGIQNVGDRIKSRAKNEFNKWGVFRRVMRKRSRKADEEKQTSG